MSRPMPVNLFTPKQEKNWNEKITESDSTLSVLILKNEKVYCYPGRDKSKGSLLTIKELGDFLAVQLKDSGAKTILIKPSTASSYRNTVDVLDQMNIHHIPEYRLLPLTGNDRAFIQQLKQ